VIFLLTALFLTGNFLVDRDVTRVFDYLVPLFLFTAIFLSRFLYRSLVSQAKKYSFAKKIQSYRNAVIVSLAVLEGANLLAIIAFMLTGEYLYLAASIIMFLLFILKNPSGDKFRTDFELTPEELSHTD